MEILSYRDLEVWRRAVDLVVECYRATAAFPKDELHGLTSQIRRAAVSVPANIAEGRGRQHSGDFTHHLSIAYGSLTELETLFEIADRVGYLPREEKASLYARTGDIGRMINGLRRAVQQNRRPNR